MRVTRERNRSRLGFYVAAVTIGAVAALVLAVWHHDWDTSPRFLNGFIALVAVALAAEFSAVRLEVGSSTFSVAFVPYLAAVFLFGMAPAMLLGALTVFIAEAVYRRKSPIKVLFNTSKEILELGLAVLVYKLLGGVPSIHEFSFALLPVVVSGVAWTAVNSLAVGFAVSLDQDAPFGKTWTRMYAGSVLYDLFATPIPGLLAYLYARFEIGGVAMLAVPLFVVRHIYVQNLRLEQAGRDLLDLMVKAIEARDPYTSGHSQRVMAYARVIAKEAGLGSRQVEQIATAALLHDVGKIYEEYAPLLRKEGRLTHDERALLQSHPLRSSELVATISTLRGTVADAVRHHHENYDGTGYPDGFAGERIPIGARIIMIADTLDAMTTDRPYRNALSFDRVVEELKKYVGRQFDPRLSEIVLRSSTIRRMVSDFAPRPAPPEYPLPPSMQGPPARPVRVGVGT
jgi:HD-GYP domain-containing protein (c-di-GMP phosphodiesterase class II)